MSSACSANDSKWAPTVIAAGRRQPEPVGARDEQDDAEEEGRQRPHEQAEGERRDVERPPATPGGEQAEGRPEQDRQHLSRQHQPEGVAERLPDELADRPVAECVAGPEVAAAQGAEVGGELRVERISAIEVDQDRLIGTEAHAQRLHGRRVEPRIAETGLRRVTRQHAEQQEVEREHDDDRDQRPADLAQQVAAASAHRAAPVGSLGDRITGTSRRASRRRPARHRPIRPVGGR